jgi:hypothetical protein
MDRGVERVVEAVHAVTDVTDADSVQALIAAQDVLDARIADALRAVDREGAVLDDGALNLVHWLRTRCGRTDRDARRLAQRAGRLAGCPALADAWRHGRLSTAQIDLVASAVNDRTVHLLREHDAVLTSTLIGLPARASAVVVRHWQAHVEALVDDHPPGMVERALYLSPGLDAGGELSGHLDPGGYEVVEAALSAATSPELDGEAIRTKAQRRGDALVAVARFFLDHRDRASSGRHRPHVHVTLTVEELERRAAGRSLDGRFVDQASMAALLCDAGIHRIVTDGASVVLDVGRTTRTVGHHLFSALAVRDQGCRFPGCDRPVSWCEAHHVVPWAHGGGTALSNLILLCWRHHHDFAHQPSWHLKLLPDASVEVTTPAGRVLTSRAPPPTPPIAPTSTGGVDAADPMAAAPGPTAVNRAGGGTARPGPGRSGWRSRPS